MTIPGPFGADITRLRRRLGLGDGPLIDFAGGLSPLGPPPVALAAAREAMERIGEPPEPGCPRLTERLADLHGVSADRVIVGAGRAELISLIGQCLREVLALHAQELGDPRMAVSHLVEPTDPAYRRASSLNELRLEVWSKHVLGWEQDFLPRSASGIFWTGHPNNPTGRAWDRERLLNLVDDTQGLLVVVDEAYLPFFPDESERTATGAVNGRGNLLVLRSLSRIFATPGLRVAYAVTSADMVTRLRQFQDPGSVTTAASAAALAALDDADHRARTVATIATESPRMLERLWNLADLRPAWPSAERPATAPPLSNFLLVSLTGTRWDSAQVQEALARRGFLVGECSGIPGLEAGSLLTGPDQLVATRGHLRISVRTRPENDRLLDALAVVLASEPPHP